jgi:predicted MFS family arabinose efflux permease
MIRHQPAAALRPATAQAEEARLISTLIAPGLDRRGVHYGWVMVGVTFLTMVATSAAMGMPGVLLVPLRDEFGWNTAGVSGAMALRLVLFGVMGPFAAALMQTYGLRTTICCALGMIVTGLVMAASMTAMWQFYLSWGVLVGAGTGMTAIVLGATVANRWFAERRGLVLGVLTSAAATGQLAFLPVAALLAERYGWRLSVLAPIFACSIAFLAMLLLGRDHPGELGLTPFGDRGPVAPPPPRAGQGAFGTAFTALGDATASPAFWVLFLTFAVCGFTTNGLVQTHFIPMCQDAGMTALAGAGVLAMMGGFDFFGSIGSGLLSDRFDSRWLLFTYYGLRGLSLLALPYLGFSMWGLSAFAVFYGLDWIATVPPTVKLTGLAFGGERAALVFGWIFTAHQLGAATAALGAGLSRDALGGYLPAFFFGGVLCLLAAVAVLALRRAPQPVCLTVSAASAPRRWRDGDQTTRVVSTKAR